MNILALVWNPKLGLDLGFITIRYYSLMYVLGFIAGYYIMKKVFRREGENEELLDPLLVYIAVGLIIGARLGHVFFYDWPYFKHHISEIFLPFRLEPRFEFTGFQGLASHGATIGIAIAAFLFWRKYKHQIRHKDFVWWVDRLILTIPFGGAMIRIGNLINSEIIGKPTGSSWGIIYQSLGENIPRHPTQLYEAGAYLLLFVLVMYLYWKTEVPHYRGLLFGIFFTLLWVIRFFIEFWKITQRDEPTVLMKITGLNTGQLLSIPFALVGLAVVIWSLKNKSEHLKA